MQDCYVGDIGDFGKYGLLRWLCGMRDDDQPLSLGVLWYRTPDKDNSDGRLTGYLEPPDRRLRESNPAEFRRKNTRYMGLRGCDEALFDGLHDLVKVKKNRSVMAVRESGILPAGTIFFEPEVPAVPHKRSAWMADGLHAAMGKHLVFADPDNGITGLEAGSRQGKRKLTHAYYDELVMCWKNGHSLVIYQHSDRRPGGLQKLVADVSDAFKEFGVPELHVLWWRREQARVYFVLPARGREELITCRIDNLLAAKWGQKQAHFDHPHFERVSVK